MTSIIGNGELTDSVIIDGTEVEWVDFAVTCIVSKFAP